MLVCGVIVLGVRRADFLAGGVLVDGEHQLVIKLLHTSFSQFSYNSHTILIQFSHHCIVKYFPGLFLFAHARNKRWIGSILVWCSIARSAFNFPNLFQAELILIQFWIHFGLRHYRAWSQGGALRLRMHGGRYQGKTSMRK